MDFAWNYCENWSKSEDDYLKTVGQRKTLKEIAKELGRTPNACASRRVALGLTKKQPVYIGWDGKKALITMIALLKNASQHREKVEIDLIGFRKMHQELREQIFW